MPLNSCCVAGVVGLTCFARPASQITVTGGFPLVHSHWECNFLGDKNQIMTMKIKRAAFFFKTINWEAGFFLANAFSSFSSGEVQAVSDGMMP